MDKSDKEIFKIATLYKFVNIKNPQNFKKKIYSFCEIFKISRVNINNLFKKIGSKNLVVYIMSKHFERCKISK